MDSSYRWQTWLVEQWSRITLPCAIVILALLPVVATAGNRPLILLVTLLPVYMLHQYEEHAHGRFVAFFNATVGRGHEVLTTRATFWVDTVGVWVVFLVAFYLARFVALGFALIPVYLTLVNGVIHGLTTARLRRYNPGLWTSLALFLPWGGVLLVYFNGLTPDRGVFNAIGLLLALALHPVVGGYVLRRRATLAARGNQAPPGLASAR